MHARNVARFARRLGNRRSARSSLPADSNISASHSFSFSFSFSQCCALHLDRAYPVGRAFARADRTAARTRFPPVASCLIFTAIYVPAYPFMKRSLALRVALLAAAVFLLPAVRAADTVKDDDEDDPTRATGKIRDMGTRKAKPDIAPASEEAELALKRMKLPQGLEVKLWAAEPMLANPVAFNFDEKGRIFVAETYRYRSSVLDIRDYMWVLEDDLASRTIEDRTRLIRNKFGPEGEKELSIEGEVLRLLEDSNGDGVADKSHVYADGFN